MEDPVAERRHQHLDGVPGADGQLSLAHAFIAVDHAFGAGAEVKEDIVLADGDDFAGGDFAYPDVHCGLERSVQQVGEALLCFLGRRSALVVCHGLSLSDLRLIWITKILPLV